ncbi:MAG: TetR/AcrR family transcriptional regulator [Acidobacteriota bacterium]
MARPTLLPEEIASFRGRLCEVALEMFAERGYGAVSLRALARQLGCSAATPYRYFESKEEIYAAVRSLGFDRFHEHLARFLADNHDPEEEIRVLGRAYFAFAEQQSHAFRIMFQLEQPAPEDFPGHHETERNAWGVLLGSFQRAVAAGVLTGSPTTLAHLFWVSIHGIASLHLAGKLVAGRAGEELLMPMVDSLIEAHRPNERKSR